MFCVEDNVIKLTKGDSATFIVNLETQTGQPYEMKDGDTLTLNMSASYGGSKLVKTSNTNVIKLNPNDTLHLQYEKGVFEIVLHSGSDVYTPVSGTTILFERV